MFSCSLETRTDVCVCVFAEALKAKSMTFDFFRTNDSRYASMLLFSKIRLDFDWSAICRWCLSSDLMEYLYVIRLWYGYELSILITILYFMARTKRHPQHHHQHQPSIALASTFPLWVQYLHFHWIWHFAWDNLLIRTL